MSVSAAEPAWARGYEVDYLRQIADCFRAVDKGIVLGAFTGVKERDIADALERQELRITKRADGAVTAAVMVAQVRQQLPVKDFTGHVRARMKAGDLNVKRMGCLPGYEKSLLSLLLDLPAASMGTSGASIWLQVWQESRTLREILDRLPVSLAAVKIPASSEIIGVYVAGKHAEFVDLPEEETWGLRRLTLPDDIADEVDGRVPAAMFGQAVRALSRVESWAEHYSSYNKRHSWSALSLRGFSSYPGDIIKPAEMSRSWKAEHPAAMVAPCRDTPMRRQFPELEPLIRLIPGEHQRIRLMRLEPGGGELTRHADITDPEAGTGHRRLLRIHIPLLTNEGVVFGSWDLEGKRTAVHMPAGSVWYLDTRKPHTAVNGGETARVHLVVDAYSSPDLLGMLR